MSVPFSTNANNASITATEFSLPANANYSSGSPQTTAAKVQFWIDATTLVAGDEFLIQVYEKVNGGTQTLLDSWDLVGATPTIFVSPILWLNEGWDITIKKISSTNRTIRWNIKSDIADINVLNWNGTAVTTPNTAGTPVVDVTRWVGGVVPAVNVTGVPKVDVVDWIGGTVPAVNVTGVPKVDVVDWVGGAVPAVNVTGVPKVDVVDWNGGAVVAPATTGVPKVDVSRINNDSSAPGNLANAYNGTGYTNDFGPAQQQQVRNIAVTSAALNATTGTRTITTGSGAGGVANTTQQDGVYDSVSDTAGTLEFFYEFDISGTSGAVGVGAEWVGYVVGVVNTVNVFARNWGGSSWDQIGSVVGITGAVNMSEDWELTSAHTSAGLVRIRFQATGLTSATVKTDRILLGYTVVPPTAAAITSAVISQLLDIENPSSHTTANTYGELLFQKSGTVGSGTNGATTFSTSLTPVTNALKNQWLYFFTGARAGESQMIASNDSSGNITMATAFTGAPSNGDRFILIGK